MLLTGLGDWRDNFRNLSDYAAWLVNTGKSDPSTVSMYPQYDDSGNVSSYICYDTDNSDTRFVLHKALSSYGYIFHPMMANEDLSSSDVTAYVIRVMPELVQAHFTHLPYTQYGDYWRCFNGVNAIADDIRGNYLYFQEKPLAQIVTGKSGDAVDENGVTVHVTADMVFVPYAAAVKIAQYYASQGGDFITNALDKGMGVVAVGMIFGAAIMGAMAASGGVVTTAGETATVTETATVAETGGEWVSGYDIGAGASETVSSGTTIELGEGMTMQEAADAAFGYSSLPITAQEVARSAISQAAQNAASVGKSLTTAELMGYAKTALTAAGLIGAVAAKSGSNTSPLNPNYNRITPYPPSVLPNGTNNASLSSNTMMLIGIAAMATIVLTGGNKNAAR
jgi:hypothetical protein